jgi:hypothetical protein
MFSGLDLMALSKLLILKGGERGWNRTTNLLIKSQSRSGTARVIQQLSNKSNLVYNLA